MNFTSISKIKSRLINIIDLVLIKYEPSEANLYALDESKLEDFAYIISDSIVSKQQFIAPLAKNEAKIPTQKQNRIWLPPPQSKHSQTQNGSKQQQQCSKIVQIVDSSKLVIYSLPVQPKSKLKQPIDKIINKKQYEFAKDTLKRFCSVCQISETKIILTGGCYFSNPTQKSASICLFQSQTGVISKIGEMLDPLSSHATVLLKNRIYIIGGKKYEGIITKTCSYFDLQSKQVVQIAALNNATASLNAINWKNNSIYKIGGVGNCFGEWNISPYIEKYYVEDDTWEVINPFISENSLKRFNQFQLYAHSTSYISSRNQLVIFGGFGFDKRGTNFGCVIQIKTIHDLELQKSEQQLEKNGDNYEQVHQIKQFGIVQGLQPGGFWNSQVLARSNQKGQISVVALQTLLNPLVTSKIVSIPTKP